MAFQQGSAGRGAFLQFCYCLGLGIPFVLVALGFGWVTGALAFVRRHARLISTAGGGLLILIGALLVSGEWNTWMDWLRANVGAGGVGIGPVNPRPVYGALRPLRMLWRRLTAMRTALILLFLLAVAAVPGSLLPQRPLNPAKTQLLHRRPRRLGPFPRPHRHVRRVRLAVVRRDLPAAVRLAGRLPDPAHPGARARDGPQAAARAAQPEPAAGVGLAHHRGITAGVRRRRPARRWGVAGGSSQREERDGALALSAEKGYSRETGNLVFHVALLCSLVLIAVGRLYSYQGSRIVIEGAGNGFCNTVSQYDSWKPGRLAAEGKISPAPFCIDELTKFTATYTDGRRADEVRAPTSSTGRALDVGAEARRDHGQPPAAHRGRPGLPDQPRLRAADHRAHARRLGAHRHRSVRARPTRPRCYSEGAFKEQGKPGAEQDVGVQGFFAPTPVDDGNGVITSASPQVRRPGARDLRLPGRPELHRPAAVGVLAGHQQDVQDRRGQPADRARPSTLAHGVSVTFDGWVPWASLQVCHDPSQGWLLGAAVAMVLGLARVAGRPPPTAMAADGPGRAGRGGVAYPRIGRRSRPQRLGKLRGRVRRVAAAAAGRGEAARRACPAQT